MPDSPRHGIPIITVVTFIFVISILPVTFTPSGSWVGSLFTCVLSTALFAFLYMTANYKWLLALPLLPYITAFIVTRNPLTAIESIVFFPTGMALVFAVKKKFTLTATIIILSAAVAGFYVIYVIISVFAVYGAVNAEILEAFRDEMIKPFRESYSQMTTISNGTEVRLYTDTQIEYMITSILRYIPAAVICVTNIITYISVLLYKGLARIFNVSSYVIPGKDWQLTMSVVSAYIYSASYLTIIFGGSATGTVTSVTANLLVILTPGFSYIGLKDLIRKFKTDKGKKVAIAVLVLTAIFLVLSPSMIFYIMSILGVVETFINHYTIKRSPE